MSNFFGSVADFHTSRGASFFFLCTIQKVGNSVGHIHSPLPPTDTQPIVLLFITTTNIIIYTTLQPWCAGIPRWKPSYIPMVYASESFQEWSLEDLRQTFNIFLRSLLRILWWVWLYQYTMNKQQICEKHSYPLTCKLATCDLSEWKLLRMSCWYKMVVCDCYMILFASFICTKMP